jgi:hypothetical protein
MSLHIAVLQSLTLQRERTLSRRSASCARIVTEGPGPQLIHSQAGGSPAKIETSPGRPVRSKPAFHMIPAAGGWFPIWTVKLPKRSVLACTGHACET